MPSASLYLPQWWALAGRVLVLVNTNRPMGRPDKILLSHPRPRSSWFSAPGIWTGRNRGSLPSTAFPFHKRWLLLWAPVTLTGPLVGSRDSSRCTASSWEKPVTPTACLFFFKNKEIQPSYQIVSIQFKMNHFALKYFLQMTSNVKYNKMLLSWKTKWKGKTRKTSKSELGPLWLNNKRSLASGEAFINIFSDQHCQMFKFILPLENSQIPFRLFGVE